MKEKTSNRLFIYGIIAVIFGSISIFAIASYGVEPEDSRMEDYSFIAQIHGGDKRCMTYRLPVNRRSVYISSDRGSYSIRYSQKGRWFSGHSTTIRRGVTDFIPVESC